jgi:hypothetical protein
MRRVSVTAEQKFAEKPTKRSRNCCVLLAFFFLQGFKAGLTTETGTGLQRPFSTRVCRKGKESNQHEYL